MRHILSTRFGSLTLAAAVLTAVGWATVTVGQQAAAARRQRIRAAHIQHRSQRHQAIAQRRQTIAANRQAAIERRRLDRLAPLAFAPGVGAGLVVATAATDAIADEAVEAIAAGGEATDGTPAPALGPCDADDATAAEPSYRVVDVDVNSMVVTLLIENQRVPVRLIGVAPMQFQTPAEGEAQPQGPPMERIAHVFMRNMLAGEQVYVVYDSQVDDTDADGNEVAYLYRAPDGMSVNLEIIRHGFAAADTRYAFDEQDSFVYYHNHAAELGKGLWRRLKQADGQ